MNAGFIRIIEMLKKTIDYINDNTKSIAIFCTIASVIASIFFLYYFDKMSWIFSLFYVIPMAVYYGIMNSNYKTRKS